MKKIKEYFIQLRKEQKRIEFPTLDNIKLDLKFVAAAVVLFGLFFLAVDGVVLQLTKWILGIGG
jgi:preprotein translocase SecE subunit